MGDNAVITTADEANIKDSRAIGMYIHWYGSRKKINNFLTYCRMKNRNCSPEKDGSGWCILARAIENFGMYAKIDECRNLDCDNKNIVNKGVFIIKDWRIVGRRYFDEEEERDIADEDAIIKIDNAQPVQLQMGKERIHFFLEQFAEEDGGLE